MLTPRRTSVWQQRFLETYDFLNHLRDCDDSTSLGEALLGFVRPYGATSLLAGLIPSRKALPKEQRAHVLLDAWPKEWSQRYFSKGYLFRDPAIECVVAGTGPLRWAELSNFRELSAGGRQVMNEAREFGLHDGVTFSFFTRERCAIGVSIASDRLDILQSDLPAISLALACGIGCAMSLPSPHCERGPVELSPRQREALCWAAEGLTVDQIGARMGVSCHTADMHLRIVREKLGVSTSIHAVAEAFRLRLIC